MVIESYVSSDKIVENARAGQKQYGAFLLVSTGREGITKVDNSFGPIGPANPSLQRERAKNVCTICDILM